MRLANRSPEESQVPNEVSPDFKIRFTRFTRIVVTPLVV